MNKFLTPALYFPLALVFLGLAIPSVFWTLIPEHPLFNKYICYWYGTFLTLGTSLFAIKLTFQQLLVLDPQINQAMVFESDESLTRQHLVLHAHSRSIELILVSVCFFSLIIGWAPDDLVSMLLFVSMRLGVILFVLGGIVIATAHFKMRKL